MRNPFAREESRIMSSKHNPGQIYKHTVKTSVVAGRVSRSKEKTGKKTPISKKPTAIAPRQFFKEKPLRENCAEKQGRSTEDNLAQYKPGESLYSLKSVSEHFSEEESPWPDCGIDSSSVDDDDEEIFSLPPPLTGSFQTDHGKEDNHSIANEPMQPRNNNSQCINSWQLITTWSSRQDKFTSIFSRNHDSVTATTSDAAKTD